MGVATEPATPARTKDFAQVEVTSRAQWRRWLQRHQGQAESIWLVTWKRDDERYLAYNDIVEEAICFGWVDSLPRKLDEARTMLLLSPRRAGSAWSRLNKARAERMIEAGKMTPRGLSCIEEARRSGLWTKLDAVEALTVPDALVTALARHPRAAEYWEAFPRSTKRAILEWIEQAKRPETRAQRIEETAAKAAENLRANQWRQPGSGTGAPTGALRAPRSRPS